MTGDRPTIAEVVAEVQGKATSVTVSAALPGGGTEFRERVPFVDLQDEQDLLDRFGPGHYKLRWLNEAGKFQHSLEVRVGGGRPAAPEYSPAAASPAAPAPPPSGELAELRRQVAELAALVRAGASPPPAAGALPAPADLNGMHGMAGVLALANAMSAPSHRMTEALLPLFMQTVKPPEKDAGTAATETLLRGIDLGLSMASGKGPSSDGEGGYADVIREVGVPLVNMLQRKVSGTPEPAPAPPVEVDPIISELAVHARMVQARCAGLSASEAAGLVDRVAAGTVDAEVPGHPGLTWRELLTDPAVRAAVGRVVPDVAQRAGWWEAFALDLWELGAPEEPETGGSDADKAGEAGGSGGKA